MWKVATFVDYTLYIEYGVSDKAICNDNLYNVENFIHNKIWE